MMAAPTGRDAVQVMIRLPSPLRDALKASAAQNDRSLATEIYHRLKANGPAEAATSPSHDPNHHHQEKAMGTRSDTTAAAQAASIPATVATDFDYKRAFQDLEDLVNRVSMATRLASYLAHEDMRVAKDGSFTASETQGDFIQFTARVAEDYAEKLHDQWLAAHNEAAHKEWAVIGRPAPEAGL